jgi:hypothetical protein
MLISVPRVPRSTMNKWVIRVLVGLALLAFTLVASGVWLGSVCTHRDDPVRNSETGARIMRMAVQQWQAAHNESSCPSMAQLVVEKQLDPGQATVDSWNRAFRLTCTADDVIVTSAGADGAFGSVDDVVVPRRGAQ